MAAKEKGICRISLIPMREHGSNAAPMVSQLLFGEHYTVLEKNEGWLLIELHFDGSKGWIREDQHSDISEDYYEQINNSDYKVCTDITGNIFFKKKNVNILLGSILPISTNELFKLEEQVAFNGASKSLNQAREFEFMKEILAKYMHTPYLPGGKSPFGIDESALVQQVFKISGYRLKRNMDEQILQGQELAKLELTKPGDVVYTGKESISGCFIRTDNDDFVGVYDGAVQKVSGDYFNSNIKSIRRFILFKK